MENKKVYLSNGEEAELLAQYEDGNKIEYVVKVVVGENVYEEGSELIYENRIVSNVYEKYEDVPMFFRKTELEKEVEGLEKKIKELTKQKANLTKKLKSIYNPIKNKSMTQQEKIEKMFNEKQKKIQQRIEEKDLNIAIGQGINNACLLLKDREDFINLSFDDKKMAVKQYAKMITEVLLEMREEYQKENNEEQPL